MSEINKIHLNIMFDPWLKIEWTDNKKEEVSLYTAITEAHHIKKIVPRYFFILIFF